MAGLRVLVQVPAEIRQRNRPAAAELRGDGGGGAARGARPPAAVADSR